MLQNIWSSLKLMTVISGGRVPNMAEGATECGKYHPLVGK